MKINDSYQRKGFIFGIFCMILLMVGSVTGAVLLPETLAPEDWPNSNWSTSTSGSPVIGISEIGVEDYWLRIRRTANSGPGTGSGAVYYTGGILIADPVNQFSDFAGSVEYRAGTGSYPGGVVLRAQNRTYTGSQGFYIAITPAGTSGPAVSGPQLGIYYNPGTGFLNGAELPNRLAAIALSSALLANQNYQIRFSAIGNVIYAAIHEYDINGNPITAPLYELTYTDVDNLYPTSGYIGLRGGQFGGLSSANFRNLEMNLIPEPGSVLLLGLATCLFLGKRCLYRR